MSDAVQQIKERLSVVDVVSSYVELHQAGKNYKGKSPFTNEKTPSFYVSPDRGMYYCFSSSQGGDIFTFIEKMEGVDFKGALKILAEKAGVELVPEDPKKRTERDTQYSILETATQFYSSWLQKKNGAEKYILDRGVTTETIGKWRIGYAPGPPEHGWRLAHDHLKEKGFSEEMIHRAGLNKKSDQGKEPYDVFRDRIMFPISDASGRIVAYSGRILEKDSEAPKYVNSPETELFNKSEILFGYDKAREGIRKLGFSLIVEGQFDVVLAHQAGYNNTVAVSGTSLTVHHASLLQRLSNKVVLALDADRAGIAAVKRAADVMLSRGIDVKVAEIPEGEDPADIISADPKKFKEIIGRSTHVIEFLLTVLKREVKDDRTYKLRAREEVVPYILQIENHIDREHFEKIIADTLGTTKDAVHIEVTRLEEDAEQKASVAAKNEERFSQKQEKVSEKNIEARVERVAQYLLVVDQLLDGDMQTVLRNQYEQITGKILTEEYEALSSECKSKLTFTLESAHENKAEKYLRLDLASGLDELRILTEKAYIAEEKKNLVAAEKKGDQDATMKSMEILTVHQKKLGKPTITEEIFTAKETK